MNRSKMVIGGCWCAVALLVFVGAVCALPTEATPVPAVVQTGVAANQKLDTYTVEARDKNGSRVYFDVKATDVKAAYELAAKEAARIFGGGSPAVNVKLKAGR